MLHPTMTRSLCTLAAVLLSAACGGDDPVGANQGDFTTLLVTPATPTLFTRAPGNVIALQVVPRDQDGNALTGGRVNYSSDNVAVAAVSSNGMVTAGNAGLAVVTVEVTVRGVTKSERSTITVRDAPATAIVTAPNVFFEPAVVDISAGGTVTWTMQEVPHTIAFTRSDAPANIGRLQGSSATRTFPNSGIYRYICEVHAAMTGTVQVH